MGTQDYWSPTARRSFIDIGRGVPPGFYGTETGGGLAGAPAQGETIAERIARRSKGEEGTPRSQPYQFGGQLYVFDKQTSKFEPTGLPAGGGARGGAPRRTSAGGGARGRPH